ncbi:HEAT repeat domain-containing protein [Armatimonas rosea]|uniref:3-methyladenine DNA glycosylase AlkC n=1 Tax=Armatimonas rosea TaxID=685828 RepID=A0A7W9SQ40_ARMRO|nr:HEAT repeat domain-containing protein [Armatimonas rosea]MBB6050123.1 3-methyladenine DNA glycosylase AlkC [Armatimonas rosea]
MDAFLFDDAAMRDFIVNGYCVLKVDLPPSFHEQVFEKTKKILAEDGNPGNNILPRIPEVQEVFDAPQVRGALTSLLGPSYVMHVHRFAHPNGPGGNGGGWHKDSYWGYSKVRDHHPRWIMAMYYPQDAPAEIGPTGAIPGSQYYESRVPTLPLSPEVAALDPDGIGLPVAGEAGSVILIHFDLWHRAFPNHTDRERYMFKFQFTRLDEPMPGEAHWKRESAEIPLSAELAKNPRSPLWRQMWHWLAGESAWETTGDPEALKTELWDSAEETRLSAAYTLGGLGAEGVAVLREGLLHDGERDDLRRAACYGLSVAGAAALPTLTEALASESERTRGYAVYALGDLGARAAEALPALTPLTDDPSAFVRRQLADALGQIKSQPELSVPALTRLLEDPDAQTRFNAAYGLAKFREKAVSAVPALASALTDQNRYVRGHATIALEQLGSASPEALKTLLHHFHTTRWCPLTTRESSF